MEIKAETLFQIANMAAMLGWLLLILLPQWKVTRVVVRNGFLSLALGLAYSVLVAVYLFRAEGGFDSLQGVMQLFSHPYVALAGWVHYLAFDLLVGCWEMRDAQRHGLPHAVLIPSLLGTFLVGPAGYVLYRFTRLMLRYRQCRNQ